MKIFHYIKNKAGSLLWIVAFLHSYQGYSQMGTFGNTYVGNGQEITIHNAQQNFLNGGSGALPGIVGTQRTASQGYLSFFGTASWISASDIAHVDGYVKTYMTTPFTFPTGDNGKFRPAAVSTASTASPADAAYYGVSGTSAVTSSISGGNEPILPSGGPYATSSLGTGITAVDNVEYWDINGATAAKITLTYNPNSAISTLTGGNLARLTIVGWDGSKWVEVPSVIDVTSLLGGSSSLSDGSITSKTAIAPNTYSVYTLGAKTPLPDIALTNICPASTVNLTTALDLSGTLPANTEITWHTGFPATVGNKVADPTMMGAGTYYGSYHDTVNDCYSPVSSAVTVTITVCANPDQSSTVAGVLKNIPILTNDKNPDGTPVTDLTKITTPTITTNPNKGTLTVQLDGSVDYTPNPGTSGTDTFIYSICDKTNATVCDTAKVTVTITPAPVANPDQSSAIAGVLKNIVILTNDKNPDGSGVTDLTKITTPTITTNPSKGTVTVQLDGSVDYTPNPGNSGTDTFIYSICDKLNATVCDTAKVTVTITPAPLANPDQPTATAGLPTTIPVLTNDKNPDGTPADLTKVTLPTVTTPTKGTATVNPDGTITYTPNPGSSGTDTFIYSICDKLNATVCDTAKVTVTITPAPVTNPDQSSAIAGVLKNIVILTNDKNPDGSGVTDLTKITTPTITANPTKGTVTVKADGSVDYTPNPGTSGTDTFIYSICDKTNATVCDTAKVTVTITPAPVANPDASTAIAGLPTTIPVLTNDKNPDGTPADLTKVTLPTVTTPTKGTATVNPDGTITYTPNPGSSGTDTFIYSICDKLNATVCDTAKVIVTITPAPVANPDASSAVAGLLTTISVLANDKNPDGTPVVDLTKVTLPTVTTSGADAPTKGTASVNPDGTITYTPNLGTSGTDTFIYSICDKFNATVCDTAKVTVTITPAPQANPDASTAIAGIPTTISVLGNDKNPDGTPADLTKVTLPTVTTPTKGTASVNPDGTITYTPNPGTSGTDTFIYSICDKTNPTVCDTAKVTVTITPAPVANPDQSPAIAGIPTTISVLGNDKNPDGTPVTDLTKVTLPTVTTPTKGTASVNPDGTITYTPNLGTSGTDTFIYSICDKFNATVCDTAKVTVTITPNKVCLFPKAYLQGALFGVLLPNTLMRDDLRVKNLLPTVSPYTSGLTTTGAITSSVLNVTGTDAIVDWVFVELRSGLDSTVIVDSRSALIQRDGDIVDVDGVGSVKFSQANAGQYYVVVKHRNHLGVMSVKTFMDNSCPVIDFRIVSTPNYNLDASNAINLPQVDVEQGKALWAGNALYDTDVIYQGTDNDVNVMYQQIINASGNFFVSPSYILKGYYGGDINMNGEVIFQGTNNDVEFIYQNVIKNHPGNIFKLNYFKIKQQIP